MAGEGDHVAEALFKPSKRRKVFRRRADSQEAAPTVDTTVSSIDPADKDEDRPSPSAPVRPQKTVLNRKHGITFSSTRNAQRQGDEENEEKALVHLHPSREQNMTQSDRFVKPMGKVALADDKHMVAFIDSKLAEARSASSAKPTEAAPPYPQDDIPGPSPLLTAQSQENRVGNSQDRISDITLPVLRPAATATGRQVQIRRQNPRPRRAPALRDANDIARDTLVDEILKESSVPLYDRSTTTVPRPHYAAAAAVAEKDDDDGTKDNDEAAANAFKAEFLAQAELHKRRKPPPPPPQKGVVTTSSGPKLGGSRSQRERMKAAAAAAAGGGEVGKAGSKGKR